MTNRKVVISAFLSLALCYGCDDPPVQDALPGFGSLDAGSDGASTVAPDSDAGGDGSAPVAVVDVDAARPLRVGPAYAVVSSDYSATSVSLLDVSGKIVADDYINSGSTRSGLVTALSGDVELPGQSNDPGVLVLIDRFKTDVITRIRLSDATILGQVKTHTPPTQQTSTSYSSNPHDYVYLDATTAWITRGEPNLDPTALPIDKGDDLFRINPTTMMRSDERIDLGVLDQSVTLKDPGSGADVVTPLYVRPTRLVKLDNTLVVGISRSSFSFSAVGDGVVALVDLTSRAVTGFPLAGFKNCTDVNPIPGDADSVLVGCSGDFNDADSRDAAGLIKLRVAAGVATVEQVWRARGDSYANALVSGSVSLGGTLVAAGANDSAGTNPDVFALLDLATGKKTEIVSVTPGKGRFGRAAFDVDSKILFLPDASVDGNRKPTSGIRRFQQNADGSFTELEVTKVAVSTNMPVHGIWPI